MNQRIRAYAFILSHLSFLVKRNHVKSMVGMTVAVAVAIEEASK